MAQFSVNTHRFDPYKNFKFKIKLNGKTVAGVSKISALKQSTEPVTHREGGDPNTQHIAPTTWKYEPITLERGVTHDPDFEAWAKLVYDTEKGTPGSLAGFRQDITIELLNEQGKVAKAYKVSKCWVSEYQALPELDANANAIAIETMVIQNEGWVRDDAVTEPTET